MEYKHIQETTALRVRNGITAHKILDIKDGHIIFQLWLNSDKQERLSVSEEFQIGQYVDLQVSRMSKTAYRVKLIGRTPQNFVPADGRAVAV